MEYRRMGKSGLRLSVLGFGAWMQPKESLPTVEKGAEIMKAALDRGCNFVDNAEKYGDGHSEILIGKILKKLEVKRSNLVISAKVFYGGKGPNDIGLSRKHIIEGLDASLEKLQVDYVDLYYCHRPDPETPIEETVRAMNHVINKGKAFYWGTSEWSASQIQTAQKIADRLDLIGPSVEQPQYSMLHRERLEKEYADLYDDIGMGTTVWSPLAFGVLTGKYTSVDLEHAPVGSRLKKAPFVKHYLDQGWIGGKKFEDLLESVDKLRPIAEKLGCSMAQLALAWCIKNPNVSSVITGHTSTAQVEDSYGAVEVVKKLTPELMKEIDGCLDNKPSPALNFRLI